MSELINQSPHVENQNLLDSQNVPPPSPYQPETDKTYQDPELDLLVSISSSLQKRLRLGQEHISLNQQDDHEYEDDHESEDDYENVGNDNNYGEGDGEYQEDSREYDEDDGDERVEFRDEHRQINQYPLTPEIYERFPFLHELPQGIAVMGGVARSAVRQFLTGDIEPIRDLDLVNINDREGDQSITPDDLDRLSKEYMPDDYAFGYGIKSESFEHYFRTRDFTINQSLILNGQLYFTDVARNDFLENIIRPTYYELPNYDNNLRSRLFLKALMMQSVISGFSSSIPTLEDIQHVDRIRTFDIALMMNKCISRDVKTAQNFTANLIDWDLIPEEYLGRPLAAAKELRQSLFNFSYYPSAYKPKESAELGEKTDHEIQEYLDSINFREYDLPDSMLDYHASDPSIRLAISEYEEGPTDQIHFQADQINPEDYWEPKEGQYMSRDFDFINSDD